MTGSFSRQQRLERIDRDNPNETPVPNPDGTLVGQPTTESLPRVRSLSTLADGEGRGPSVPLGVGEAGGSDPVPVGKGVRYGRGNRIGGRYEVLDIFGGPGRSGMGVVYLCRDRVDRRLCALKSFQDQPVWSPQAAKTFRREAELWIALGHHPHVVAARTIRKPDGRLYLVLEYIEPDEEGRNCLSHYLTGRPLAMDQILKWAVQFCWGMEHAIEKGIRCHRDVKPDNLMIDTQGRLKISDFGLAKALDGLSVPEHTSTPAPWTEGLSLVNTQAGTTCGSPPWMAPEQFGDAAEADVRSDVYSFGVVLFQMLSGGRLPFEAATIQGYATLHRHAPVPRLESPLDAVVERCMAKRPEDRYPDFAALRGDLETRAAELGLHVPEYQELPETAERLKDWTSSLTNLGRYEEALAFADRATREAPEYAPAWINRSRCCLCLNQFKEAIRSAQQAIELDADSALAWTNFACAHQRMGNLQEAFFAARRARKLDPELIGAWNAVGALHHIQKQHRQAIDCYLKVVEIDPFCFDACMNLALSYCGIGDARQVYKWYARAAEIDPDNDDAKRGRDDFGDALGRM